MAKRPNRATGVRQLSPGVWEIIAPAGRDPVTGKYRQVSRVFKGNLRDAKVARGNFVAEVKKGRHLGTSTTVEQLCTEWLAELQRKGRSPNTIDEYRRTYYRDIHACLGGVSVAKVHTKMLTDLYREHQRRGTSAYVIGKIHSTISSMMTQGCKWGWRDSNPAEWADPPPLPDRVPLVPTPSQVGDLLKASKASKRPVYETIIFLAATSGIRRGEICGLRRSDIDHDKKSLEIARGIVRQKDEETGRAEWIVHPTKNRRKRTIALDDRTLALLQAEITRLDETAKQAGHKATEDAYILTRSLDGSSFWVPDTITQYFKRLCKRNGYPDLTFKLLRKFMDTYGQELGFPRSQIAVRAGHDPAVAGKHYTGRVAPTDHLIADGLSNLLGEFHG